MKKLCAISLKNLIFLQKSKLSKLISQPQNRPIMCTFLMKTKLIELR